MTGVLAGIPPEHCQLPLEPEISLETTDAIRFGTEPESRFEYSSFPRSVSTQYVSRVTAETRDWSKLCHVTSRLKGSGTVKDMDVSDGLEYVPSWPVVYARGDSGIQPLAVVV